MRQEVDEGGRRECSTVGMRVSTVSMRLEKGGLDGNDAIEYWSLRGMEVLGKWSGPDECRWRG